jgi:hypothetical protein
MKALQALFTICKIIVRKLFGFFTLKMDVFSVDVVSFEIRHVRCAKSTISSRPIEEWWLNKTW